MKTVWKYILEPGETTLEIPVGAQILSVAVQGEEVCLWALVEPDAIIEPRQFIVAGTGESIPDKYQPPAFIGTVHLSAFLVFHVFELTIR